jgi:hypothetical protein
MPKVRGDQTDRGPLLPAVRDALAKRFGLLGLQRADSAGGEVLPGLRSTGQFSSGMRGVRRSTDSRGAIL